MILSRKGLEDYVDTKDISYKEFCDAMTLSGSKVEEFNVEGSELENIVAVSYTHLDVYKRQVPIIGSLMASHTRAT